MGAEDNFPSPSYAKAVLLAVVTVNEEKKVQCQQEGCGRLVHAAVHVVQIDGRTLLLGSTCFAKRFGSLAALGRPHFGGVGGGGRRLTDEERDMLFRNAAELLARFEREKEDAAKQGLQKPGARNMLSASAFFSKRRPPNDPSPTNIIRAPASRRSPWPWQKPLTSIAIFSSPEGRTWIRVQHADLSQKLVPWPKFLGWEHALPPEVGTANMNIEAIDTSDIVQAFKILRKNGYGDAIVGAWEKLLR